MLASLAKKTDSRFNGSQTVISARTFLGLGHRIKRIRSSRSERFLLDFPSEARGKKQERWKKRLVRLGGAITEELRGLSFAATDLS